MPNFGLRVPIAAALTLTLAGLAIAPAATATAEPTPADLALTAQATANSTNQSYIDGDWDGVTTHADAFDAAYGDLVAQFNVAKKDLKALNKASKKQSGPLADAIDDAEAKRVAKSGLKSDWADTKGRLGQAESHLEDAKQRNQTADEELERVTPAYEAADAAYSARVHDVIAGKWTLWAFVFDGDNTTTVRELAGANEDTKQKAKDLRAESDRLREIYEGADGNGGKKAEYSEAQSIFYSTAANWKSTGVCSYFKWDSCRTSAGIEAANDLAALKLERNDASDAYDDADDAADDAERWSYFVGLAYNSALIGVAGKKDAYDTAKTEFDVAALEAKGAGDDLDALQAEYDALALAVPAKWQLFVTARAVWQDAVAEANTLQGTFDQLQLDIETKKAEKKALNKLIKGLNAAKQDVADRRADLADFHTVLEQTKVSLPGSENVSRTAGVVTLPFSITNSQLFDLSDATVEITAPLGLVADCDIPDSGIVAAGAVVDCSVDYVIPATDLFSDSELTITVVLSGYIPLGPGNPRAAAVSRTLVSVTSTTTIQITGQTPVEVPAQEQPAAEETIDAEPVVSDDAAAEANEADGAGESSEDSDPDPAAVTTAATPVAASDDDATVVTTSAELSGTGPSDVIGSLTDTAVLLLVGLGLVLVSRRRYLSGK
ncbi:hypothetical protein [Demequina oxidasica]|uniref:hypothetical protein n=1 Tax=Demequina oxidasica TaxID=676199 RepID=UPI000784FA1E|nr:hypothetical protein [Demequina oxidasica]